MENRLRVASIMIQITLMDARLSEILIITGTTQKHRFSQSLLSKEETALLLKRWETLKEPEEKQES